MLFSDVICFALLTITVTATCVGGHDTTQELAERKTDKRTKRESAVLIDSYPTNTFKTKPDIIIRRVSKTKYRKPKPKYGPPRPKYGPPKPKYGPPPSRKPTKPVKKYRRKQIRSNKSRKRVPKPQHTKPYYGLPQTSRPYPYYTAEPVGFAEPPKDLTEVPKHHSYGEPPVDSYGAPLSPAIQNIPEAYAETNDYTKVFGQQQQQSFNSYQQDLNIDNINSNSLHFPIYSTAFKHGAPVKYDDLNLNSYEDVYKQSPQKDHHEKHRSKIHVSGLEKNKPWKSKVKGREHVLVGGQYAEPPARLVPSFQPSAPVFEGPDDFSPLKYLDSDVAASASISPYVNYKNSNMAFSPQNLNDAFSL